MDSTDGPDETPSQERSLKEFWHRWSRHTILRNVLLLYIIQFSGYLLPLITLPYLSRILSPEKFGLIAFAQVFCWYFVTLTEYGFNLTATRAAAISPSLEETSRLFGAVFTAKLLLTAAGLIILVVSVLAVPSLRPNLVLFLVSFVAVIGYAVFPLWLYQGLQKMGQIAVRDLVSKALSLVALFTFVHSDRDYLLAAAAQSGGILLSGLLGLFAVRYQLNVHFRRPEWSQIRHHLIEGWPAFLSQFLAAFWASTNTIVLGLHSSGAEVAYFSATNRVMVALKAMITPITTAIFPHASRKAARSEREVLLFVQKYQYLFVGPFVLLGIALLVTAPWVVPLALGKEYRPAATVLQVLAFSPALMAVGQVYTSYYMLPCGYDKPWMRIMVHNAILNFVFLIPTMMFFRGSVAVAITLVAVELIAGFRYWKFFSDKLRQVEASSAEQVT